MALDFYHGHGSPYSWRVWLALEHKKIPYDLKVLSFEKGDTRKPEFIAINPRHQVPTIVDEGFALWESVPILEYLDEKFPGGAKLYPGDVRERARTRRLVREVEEYLGNEGMGIIAEEFFFSAGGAPDMAKVEKARIRLAEEFDYLAKELRGHFFSGAEVTAADIVLYPIIGYANRITFRKPESKLTELVPAPIAAWAKRMEALPYFGKTFPPHWK